MRATSPESTLAKMSYPSNATPPASQSRARSSGPSHQLFIPSYPENPMRHLRQLSDPITSAPPIKGLDCSPVQGRRHSRRYNRTGRRVIAVLVLCSFIVFLMRIGTRRSVNQTHEKQQRTSYKPRWVEEEDGLCRFVSPVEAYFRDLERLRKIYPHRTKGQWPSELLSENDIHILDSTIHDHYFAAEGHLQVSNDTDSPHPIPVLLALGETRWERLLARQSTTLPQAVQEYKRRYGRQPPRGFDIWWDFAMAHNLVLPDEYDRINLDLAPFFALPKGEMKRRMKMVEEMPETFTLVVKDGRVNVQILDDGGLKWDGTLPRAKETASLLDIFARFLPDLKATFSIFDQPQIYISWARKDSLVKLGQENEHTTHLQETDSAHVRIERSCPPDSNLRSQDTGISGHSFIYDTLQSSDICQNPYVVPIHGLTLEPHGPDSHPRPHTQLLPLFSLAKTSINSDILITPLDQFFDDAGFDPKWEDKKSSKLGWAYVKRGSTTGMSMMTRDLDWRNAHRIRLHRFANNRSPGSASFLAPYLKPKEQEVSFSVWTSEQKPLGTIQEEERKSDVADFYYDMKLAGGPLQCSDDDGTCHDMRREIAFAGYQNTTELNQNKFLLDIDGNGWRRLMSTNSLVIKTSLFTEWFQPHLIPWFMYVPAKLDFSDLTDILAFFRGTPKMPNLAFDETAKAIAHNGQCFARRMFRMEDLQAYMMRLFLEYARLASDEGLNMDFVLPDESAEERPEETLAKAVSAADGVEMELEEEHVERVADQFAPDGSLAEIWAAVDAVEPELTRTPIVLELEEQDEVNLLEEDVEGGGLRDGDGLEGLLSEEQIEGSPGEGHKERFYGNDMLEALQGGQSEEQDGQMDWSDADPQYFEDTSEER